MDQTLYKGRQNWSRVYTGVGGIGQVSVQESGRNTFLRQWVGTGVENSAVHTFLLTKML